MPTPDRTAWHNGAIRRWADLALPLMAQSVQRGTLVFDIFDVVQTSDGPKGLGAHEHLDRFLASAAGMGMEVGPSRDELWDAVRAVVAAEPDASYVRLCAWWGDETFALHPTTTVPDVAVLAFSGADLGSITPVTAPARLTVAPSIKLPARVLDPTVKVAASYTHGVVASMAAKRAGFDDIVFLDENGQVAESSVMSLVLVTDGRLLTAPTDVVLDGITRRIALDAAADEGIDVTIAPLDLDDLASADEAFLCSTSRLVWPIASVDEYSFTAPGPISERLSQRLRAILADDDPLTGSWLQPLS